MMLDWAKAVEIEMAESISRMDLGEEARGPPRQEKAAEPPTAGGGGGVKEALEQLKKAKAALKEAKKKEEEGKGVASRAGQFPTMATIKSE